MELSFLEIPGCLDLLEIICRSLDFRDLLSLKRTSKDSKWIAEFEISRREKILNLGFYSDEKFWFLGRRCPGASFLKSYKFSSRLGYPIKLTRDQSIDIACDKFEEITIFGDNKRCRNCLKLIAKLTQEEFELKIMLEKRQKEEKLKEKELNLRELKKKQEAEITREKYIETRGTRGLINPKNNRVYSKIIKTKNSNEL